MKLFEHHYCTFQRNAPDSIKGAVPVDVHEVADWYYKEAEIEELCFREQLPTLISPWSCAVYEYRFPPYFKSMDGKGGWHNVKFENVVGYNCCVLLNQEKLDPMADVLAEQTKIKFLGEQPAFRQVLLIAIGNKKTFQPLAVNTLILNQDGAYLQMGMSTFGQQDHQSLKQTEDALRNMIYPVYFAINLMHCRNVRTVDTEIPSKLQKARTKIGRPIYAWKRIVIDPMRKKVTQAHKTGKGNTISLALRIARGHWKDYTQGKGLFGKHKGRYWWDDVADGSLGREYTIKKPEEVEI